MAFEDAHGPRDTIAHRIANVELNEKQETLVSLMLDPARKGDSLALLAADAGVTPEEVLTLFQKGAIAEAKAIATGLLADSLPAVTQAVISRAVEREVDCRCGVPGQPDPKCSKCRGTGKYTQEADTERQKMIWDSTGLMPKKAGLSISQTQQVGVVTGAGSFMDSFVKRTDQVAYDVRPGDIVDTEVK